MPILLILYFNSFQAHHLVFHLKTVFQYLLKFIFCIIKGIFFRKSNDCYNWASWVLRLRIFFKFFLASGALKMINEIT